MSMTDVDIFFWQCDSYTSLPNTMYKHKCLVLHITTEVFIRCSNTHIRAGGGSLKSCRDRTLLYTRQGLIESQYLCNDDCKQKFGNGADTQKQNICSQLRTYYCYCFTNREGTRRSNTCFRTMFSYSHVQNDMDVTYSYLL